MNFHLTYLFLVFFILFGSAQTDSNYVLPIVKNGKWYLLSHQHEIQLPSTYKYVSTFDQKGLANFWEGKNHGIINSEGKEIYKANTQEINQLGNGIYSKSQLNGFSVFNPIKNTQFECSWLEQIDENWIAYKIDDEKYIYNFNWDNGLKLNNKIEIIGTYKSYFILKDSLTFLFDPNGIIIDHSNSFFTMDEKHLYYKGDSTHLFINTDLTLLFDQQVKNVTVSEKTLKIKYGNRVKITDLETNKTIIDYPCDNLIPENNYYKVTKNQKTGLIDLNGKVLIPIQFELINHFNKGYIVTKNDLKGFYSNNFIEKIKCEFNYLSFQKDFIHTQNYLGKSGLINASTFEVILPALFYNINIQGKIIKAYNETKMALVQLNENNQVIDRVYIDHIIHIPTNKRLFSFYADKRLFSIGWYLDSSEIKLDKNNRPILMWGLKNQQDSILLNPSKITPIYIEKAPFSLLPKGEFNPTQFKSLNTYWKIKTDVIIPSYQLIDYSTGKKLKTPTIISIDTTDFLKYSFARIQFEKGMGLINKSNEIKYIDYIDKEDNEFIRYCYSKEIDTANVKNPFALKFSSLEINTSSNLFNQNYCFQMKNAVWNYIDKNGDSLFQTNFDFVQPFYKGTAIVKQKNGWGVVNKDTVFIPTIFSNIKRIDAYKDTLFLVSLKQKGKIYLDSNLTEIPFENAVFHKNKDGNFRFILNNSYQIYNDENEATFESRNNIKFKNYGYFTLKNKRIFEVYNTSGILTCSSVLAPLEFITQKNFLTIKDTKYGVLSVENDTILPFNFKKIERISDYIIGKMDEFSILYDTNFNEMKRIKNKLFIVDTINKNWGIQSNNSIQIYSKTGKKINSWKIKNPIQNFVGNYLLSKEGVIYKLDGTSISLNYKCKNMVYFESKTISIEDNKGQWYIYDEDWNLLSDTLLQNKKLTYHGDYTYSVQSKGKWYIYDLKNPNRKIDVNAVSGNWKEGFLKLNVNNTNIFIDRNFENQFQSEYKTAHNFKENFAAVCLFSGWTIINKNGESKSLPSFPEIKAIHQNLYETDKKTWFGIYDSHGTCLIEPIYEKITVLENNLIQCIKDGQIFYYNSKGTKLY